MQTKKTILIVDDDELITGAIQSMLEQDGHTVFCCHNGFDAVELSKKQDFNVILTDYHMPVMRGDTVCRLIRQHNPDVFIIGCSSDQRDKAFLSAGADIFITKDQLVENLAILTQGS
jgi:two-component system, OmpR family, response regulator VicR